MPELIVLPVISDSAGTVFDSIGKTIAACPDEPTAAALVKLINEAGEVKLDATRYRFLKAGHVLSHPGGEHYLHIIPQLWCNQLDAAIDSAIAQGAQS